MHSSSCASAASRVLISSWPPSAAFSWSSATTLNMSVVASVSTLRAASWAIGSRWWRRANSSGTRCNASGSATTWVRSIPWLPSALASWSRSTASVMKPSATSWRPIGRPVAFCSLRPMRSWSTVMSPWVTRVSPMRSFLRLSMAPGSSAGRLQLLHPRFGLGAVESVCATACKRFLVVREGGGNLTQLIEADRQVEGVVGIVGSAAIGLEVGGLGVVPACLASVEIAEGLVELRAGVAFDQRLQAAFGSRVVRVAEEVEQGALGHDIARIEIKHFAIETLRIGVAMLHTRNRCQAKQRIHIAPACGGQGVEPLRLGQRSALIGSISLRQHGGLR